MTASEPLFPVISSNTGGGGGSGTPGGSNTQVQFNDGGSFGGDSGLIYQKGSDSLYAGSFATTLDGTVTRSNNYISIVSLSGGKTIGIARSSNYISIVSDGLKTWTYTRNTADQVISWSVT